MAGHRDAVRITTAASEADDIAARQRRYVISMGIRTLCFVGAIVVGPGWLRWVLVAGAVLLPYVAVVMANAGDHAGRRLRCSGGGAADAPGRPTHPHATRDAI